MRARKHKCIEKEINKIKKWLGENNQDHILLLLLDKKCMGFSHASTNLKDIILVFKELLNFTNRDYINHNY